MDLIDAVSPANADANANANASQPALIQVSTEVIPTKLPVAGKSGRTRSKANTYVTHAATPLSRGARKTRTKSPKNPDEEQGRPVKMARTCGKMKSKRLPVVQTRANASGHSPSAVSKPNCDSIGIGLDADAASTIGDVHGAEQGKLLMATGQVHVVMFISHFCVVCR
jgi:hypothetical protein